MTKKAGNADFVGFLRLVEANADDERNFVKKAVSWAPRQISKCNSALNAAAVACA
jgi:3-methyladenine DNA glycosylase AlkD